MIQIKKTILTLVALLAVTTGAWADTWNSGACTVTLSDGVMTVSGTGAMADYKNSYELPWYGYDIETIVIESGVSSIGNSAFAKCRNVESVSIPASVTSIGNYAFEECGDYTEALTVSFAEGSTLLTIGQDAFNYAKLKSIDIPNSVTSIGRSTFYNCSILESVSIPANVTSIGEGAFSNCGMLANVYIYAPSLTTYGDMAFQDNASGRKIHVLSDAVDTYKAGWPDYAADFVGDLQPLASGPEVAWNKTSKTGTFKMPGGNVTLEPEYYDLATLADMGLTAAEDAAAKTEAPLAVLAENAITGGTVMYYVAPDANFSQADAIALAETAWSADIPTAETIDAAGTYYVWYYIKGDDEHSDTDPQPLAVTVLPEPTYAVEFAEGTEESDKWTADPAADVKKGQTVTVTYSGSKKIIGVKAEKKASAAAFAADEYNEASWDDTNKKVVFEKKKATTTPVSVADAATNVTWGDGWYTVSGNVTITGNVTLTADAHLILQDGATLTINGQLDCRTNRKNLYIYGQKKGDGKLNVTNNSAIANNSSIAINSEWNYRIDIHGGEVTAASTSNIGLNTGYLAVYGGKLTATSGLNGINFNNAIDVYGGVVEATSNATSGVHYGIVWASDDETLTVYGGKVTATGNGESDDYGNYGSGFRCYVKSGTSGIKFYFSDNGTTWGDGTSYDSATEVGTSYADAATKKRYAKAE